MSFKTKVAGTFRIWRCGCCGFEWTDRDDLNGPNAANYDDYPYNVRSHQLFGKVKSLYRKGLEQRVDRLLLGKPLRELSFLDVGCANGEYLWAASDLGFGYVAGVEIDDAAAARARKYGEVAKSVSDLSVCRYDVVHVKNVVNNIAAVREFMRSCVGAIKPGGVLMLDVLNQGGLTAFLRKQCFNSSSTNRLYGCMRPPFVINGFNRNSLQTFLAEPEFGLSVLRITTVSSGTPMLPYSASYRTRLLGRFATLLGAGSMLLSESRREVDCCP